MERASGTTEAAYTSAFLPSTSGRGAGGEGPYGPMLSQRRSGASRFYHPSLLGTVEALTDAAGDTTDSYVLDAFGVQHASSGSTVNPHVFIGSLGYYTDPLGPLYVRARWLRPGTGSWLSADPVLSEPRFQYVGGRASWGVDGSGRQYGDMPFPDPRESGLTNFTRLLNRIWPHYDPPPSIEIDIVQPEPAPRERIGGDVYADFVHLVHPGSHVVYFPYLPPTPRPGVDKVVMLGHGYPTTPSVSSEGPDVTPSDLCRVYPDLCLLKVWGCWQGRFCDAWGRCYDHPVTVTGAGGICVGPVPLERPPWHITRTVQPAP